MIRVIRGQTTIATTVQTEHTQLIRGLGLIAAISVNVANIIGTGVFLKARVVTCNVGSPGKALAIWVFAGLLSIAGALTYAELLAMMPRAAGEKHPYETDTATVQRYFEMGSLCAEAERLTVESAN